MLFTMVPKPYMTACCVVSAVTCHAAVCSANLISASTCEIWYVMVALLCQYTLSCIRLTSQLQTQPCISCQASSRQQLYAQQKLQYGGDTGWYIHTPEKLVQLHMGPVR